MFTTSTMLPVATVHCFFCFALNSSESPSANNNASNPNCFCGLGQGRGPLWDEKEARDKLAPASTRNAECEFAGLSVRVYRFFGVYPYPEPWSHLLHEQSTPILIHEHRFQEWRVQLDRRGNCTRSCGSLLTL